MGAPARHWKRPVTSPGLPWAPAHFKVGPHMRSAPLAALALVLAIAAGCARPEEVYAISFRSNTGMDLAAGTIELPVALPTSGPTRGWYKLQLKHVQSANNEVKIFYQLFDGKESGRMEWTVGTPRSGTSASTFDFMPGFVDANIIAHASPTAKGYWRGRWSYSLFPGGHEGGSFNVSQVSAQGQGR